MKKVLLTGASSGLGIILAENLLKNNYFVILHYYKNKDKLMKLHEKYQSNSLLWQADLKNEEEILIFKKELEKRNIEIDILINNAAIENLSDLEKKNAKTMIDVFKLNTVAPFLLCKIYGPEINSNKGVILNISSDNTVDKYDEVTIEYDVSKAGLNMLTKEFAKIYQKAKVNAICFGWLDTPMNDIPENIKKEMEFLPLKTAIQKIIELLESEKSGYIEVVK